ncbi:ATP-binding protein [Candidatus Margulisiibacteriota bacterium]
MINKNKLSWLLTQPEGQYLEFKKSTSSLAARTMAAFANSGGGIIIAGVDDNNNVIGISNINKAISRVQSTARSIEPKLAIQINSHDVDEKTILVIEIPDGEELPYCTSEGFFLRSSATTQKMTRDEIIQFLYSSDKIPFDNKDCKDFKYPEDFDSQAFRVFAAKAGISTEGMDIKDILVNIGVATKKRSSLVFNRAGVLFFAKEPVRFFFQAEVDCMLLQGYDKVHILDRNILKNNIVTNVEQAMIFLNRHLSLRYEFTGELQRKEILEIPPDALREALLNALMHRDYHIRGGRVSIEIYRDRVEISSPGGLPKGMRLRDLGKKSIPRNALIADMFHRLGEVEKAGSGIKRIREEMKKAGLPNPKYEITGFCTVVFGKKDKDTIKDTIKDTVKDTLKDTVKDTVYLSEREQSIITAIDNAPNITINKIAEEIGINVRNTKKYLAGLKEKGILKRIGSDKNGHWEVIDTL